MSDDEDNESEIAKKITSNEVDRKIPYTFDVADGETIPKITEEYTIDGKTPPNITKRCSNEPKKSFSDAESKLLLSEELESLQAIFPEIVLNSPYHGSIEIPVIPSSPVNIIFKDDKDEIDNNPIIYSVKHLPPIIFKFKLPKSYPLNAPPRISIESTWMSSFQKKKLISKLLDLWKQLHDVVLYSMIDNLIQEMTSGFPSSSIYLHNEYDLKHQLLSYDAQALVHDFETQTFKCEICQYLKRGSHCTKLQKCSHIFCTDCLKAYFTACIEQGYISQVICPHPDCNENDRILNQEQIEQLVGRDLSRRFIDLSKKLMVESNPNLFMFCPRDLCQELIKRTPDDLLTICPKCDFAFCYVCKRSWHGYYEYCRMQDPPLSIIEKYIDGDENTKKKIDLEWGKRNMARYVAEFESDKSFKEYMESNNNRACPKCTAPIEKSMGCNKMTCSICHTYFCFLCVDILDRDNPYKHYGNKKSGCYQKLFEGTDIEAAELPPEFLIGLAI